jgi:hypothetical protein
MNCLTTSVAEPHKNYDAPDLDSVPDRQNDAASTPTLFLWLI